MAEPSCPPPAQMLLQVHSLDLRAARRLSRREVASRLGNGWRLMALAPEHAYASSGGAGHYHHVLVGPGGELGQLTQAVVPPGTPVAGTVTLDYAMLALEVPYADREAVRALGAVWLAWARCWAIDPRRTAALAAWLPDPPRTVSLQAP